MLKSGRAALGQLRQRLNVRFLICLPASEQAASHTLRPLKPRHSPAGAPSRLTIGRRTYLDRSHAPLICMPNLPSACHRLAGAVALPGIGMVCMFIGAAGAVMAMPPPAMKVGRTCGATSTTAP